MSVLERHDARNELVSRQSERLGALLAEILPHHRFYAEKFASVGLTAADIRSPADLTRLPFTTKAELLEEQAQYPRYGRLLTYPLEKYCRYYQTSGTSGQPLRWLDTADSWRWTLDCWRQIYAIVGVRAADRLFFPFSFGPFLGFWTAFEGATQVGCLCLPGGSMSSLARLQFLLDNEATVVLCTPTYALHLVEVARQHNMDLRRSAVWAILVAGEPGGSIPATRQRIEDGWGARVFDHSGLTEVGPLSIECRPAPGGLHILEEDFLVEVIDPDTGGPVAAGQVGELVLSNLGRWGSPLLRYRTGDLVRVDPRPCACGLPYLRLDGGILGRSDELIHVRGNNVYPGALEAILREFPDVVEYRIEVDETRALATLRIEVEPSRGELGTDLAATIQAAIRDRLLFRAEVVAVACGSLPRFELKARRLMRRK